MRKRFKVYGYKDRRSFAKSGQMMNSENRPRMQRGGRRF